MKTRIILKRPAFLAMLSVIVLLGVFAAVSGQITLSLVGPAVAPALVEYNYAVDNADAIEAYIKAGRRIPPGIYCIKTTIEVSDALRPSGGTFNGSGNGNWVPGMTLEGSGAAHAVSPESIYYVDTPKRVTLLVWAGDPGGVMLKIRSPSFTVKDISLWGQRVANIDAYKALDVDNMTGTLVQIIDGGPGNGYTYPVGHTMFERVCFGVASKAVEIPGVAGATHCDHVKMSHCRFHFIQYPYTVDNEQSLQHDLNLHLLNDGYTILNFKRGGRVKADLVIVRDWNEILKLGPGVNDGNPATGVARYGDGYFDIHVSLDNLSNITNCVVETDEYNAGADQGASVVTITGDAAGHMTGGVPNTSIGPPVLLNNSRVMMNVYRTMAGDIVYPPEQ